MSHLFGPTPAQARGVCSCLQQHAQPHWVAFSLALTSRSSPAQDLTCGCISGKRSQPRLGFQFLIVRLRSRLALYRKSADRSGRRPTLLLAAALFAITTISTGAAQSFTFFITVRFLGGIAVGAVSILSPLYIAEIAPPRERGRLGALYQMSIVTGILLSYLTNYWLRNAGPNNWRWMFLTGVVPAVIFFGLLLRAPETPRYLMMAGRISEARRVLEHIVGPDEVTLGLETMRTSFSHGRQGWSELLRPGLRRAVTISFFLAILVHVSGVNTVIDYAPSIFQSAGLKIDAALFGTFMVGVTSLVFTLVSFWMIDRWGRKPLYVLGSIMMGVVLSCLTLLSVFNAFHGLLVPILVMTYLASFACCNNLSFGHSCQKYFRMPFAEPR